MNASWPIWHGNVDVDIFNNTLISIFCLFFLSFFSLLFSFRFFFSPFFYLIFSSYFLRWLTRPWPMRVGLARSSEGERGQPLPGIAWPKARPTLAQAMLGLCQIWQGRPRQRSPVAMRPSPHLGEANPWRPLEERGGKNKIKKRNEKKKIIKILVKISTTMLIVSRRPASVHISNIRSKLARMTKLALGQNI